MKIEIVKADITEQQVDAVVNAANPSLMGGSGVDGAIHRAGGPSIIEECRRIRRDRYPDGLPTGMAVATTAGELPARWVIHTVGPIYASDPDPEGNLRSCYLNSLRVADELGAGTLAFPAISAGAYGYPLEEAARVALAAVRSAQTSAEVVRFVLFGDHALGAFARARDHLDSDPV